MKANTNTKSLGVFGIFMVGTATYLAFRALRRKICPPKPAFFDPKQNPEKHDARWDAVDEAAWESFPASDPPATW